MVSFLGGPIQRRGVVYGNLYLTDRLGADEFSASDEELLAILATQAAMAIENTRRFLSLVGLRNREEAALRQAELEQLKANIISLVSHELRTPLSHIKGHASSLLQPDVEWDAATQRDFIASIERQADPRRGRAFRRWRRLRRARRGDGADLRGKEPPVRAILSFAAGQAPDAGHRPGVATCREIVQAHGGRIWAESTEGEGSVSRFTLPRGDSSEGVER